MSYPEITIADRDYRAFELRKMGLSFKQIGRTLDIHEQTARTAVRRTTDRLNRHAETLTEVVRTDLERLDTLLANIWSMTMPHKVVTPDGEEITLPPNMDAIDRVLKIMSQKAKLLGLDQVTVNISGGNDGSGSAALGAKQKPLDQITAKDEAQRLLKIMGDSGVLPLSVVNSIREATGSGNDEEIIDAEVVDDPPMPELGPGDFG